MLIEDILQFTLFIAFTKVPKHSLDLHTFLTTVEDVILP